MICKDCEMEVSKLTKNGICKQCQMRQYNCTYKGINYIPLKDLKGTKEYNVAMGKRYGKQGAKIIDLTCKEQAQPEQKEIAEEVEQPKENDSLKSKYYMQVYQDAKKVFDENNLDINFLNKINLKDFIVMLTNLIENNDAVEDAEKALKIFNDLSTDYSHLIENSGWDEESMEKGYGLQKALLELRRPTKDFIYSYNSIKEIIDYLKQDDYLRALIDRVKNSIEKDAMYRPRKSEIVAKEDFALKMKKYICSVQCYNLYGSRVRSELKTTMDAVDEEQAKRKFQKFIIDKFTSIVYKDEDIRIEEK